MTRMPRSQLVQLLQNLARAVESGDSAEGSLSYSIAEEPAMVEVEAALRTGNLDGQGGMVIL